jgi:ribosomal protein S18 acetylase RimI-like enzyme
LQEMLVAVQERQVVGYVHARVSHSAASSSRVERRFGEIESLAVLPRVQRLGLGRKLIEGAWEWLSSQGLDDCQIAVHAFNAEATRLYRRMGFAPSVTLLRRKG